MSQEEGKTIMKQFKVEVDALKRKYNKLLK